MYTSLPFRPVRYTVNMSRSHEYSQHFLRNPQIVAELLGHTTIRKNDTVVDLGAGSGVITSVLANKCSKVIALEVEPAALQKLRDNLSNVSNVEILEVGILEFTIPNGSYKIFSNIPFSISAQILRKFTEAENPPRAMYVIAQKQFARKIVPSDTHFTAQLGAQMGPYFSTRIRKPLSKSDFTPPPGVDTVLLEIIVRDEPLLLREKAAEYREFVGRCFERQKFFATVPLDTAGISAFKSPSQLSIDEWVRLFEHVR